MRDRYLATMTSFYKHLDRHAHNLETTPTPTPRVREGEQTTTSQIVQHPVVRFLATNYDCKDVTFQNGFTNMRISVTLPTEKVMSLQCDQTSGRLASELQTAMVQKEVLKKLDCKKIVLGTELKQI